MHKKIMLVGLVGISVVAMFVAEAFGYHGGYSIGGTNTTKGVRSLYVVTGTGKNPTTLIVQIESDNGLLQCINQGENSPSDVVAIQFPVVLAGEGSDAGEPAGGNSSQYDVITLFDGTASDDAACDASPECNELRQFCNSAQWVPIDFVPITFCGMFTAFACSSAQTCPCDPDGVNASLCADHDPRTPGVLDPLGPPEKIFCELPNPDTFQFGEARVYNCVAATPQVCPGLFP